MEGIQTAIQQAFSNFTAIMTVGVVLGLLVVVGIVLISSLASSHRSRHQGIL